MSKQITQILQMHADLLSVDSQKICADQKNTCHLRAKLPG